MTFFCARCGNKMDSRDKKPGDTLFCTECGTALIIPEEKKPVIIPVVENPETLTIDTPPVQSKLHHIVFTGDGWEYFKIWIVNIFLTIVTLGVYSAWAKVRTKRYFYGNTLLDGVPFEYTADPIRILIGRLIAFTLVALFAISQKFLPWLSVLLIIFGFCVMPWLIYKTLRFNARYSSYRNINFGFTGTIGESYVNFFLWQLLGTLIGLTKPIADYYQTNFVVTRYRYGKTPFSYSGTIGHFYTVFAITMAIGFGAYFILAPIMIAIVAMGRNNEAGLSVGMIFLTLLGGIAILAVTAYTRCKKAELTYNHIHFPNGKINTTLKFSDVFKLYLVNYVLIIFTLGIATPWVMIRNARYLSEHINVALVGDWDQFKAGDRTEQGAIGEEIGDVFDYDFDIGL